MGEAFKDQLLAVCDTEGDNYGRPIFVVDAAKDTSRQISGAALATCSYDGKTVITQGSFNLSPSGGISVFARDEFLGKDARSLGGIGDSIGYAYSPGRGSYWICDASVYGGSPLGKIKEGLGLILIPDMSQPIVYSIGDKVMAAHRLSPTLDQIGKRKLVFPEDQARELHHIWQQVFRHRAYILDHPVGYVHGNDLHLFVIDVAKNLMLRAKTSTFVPANVAAGSGSSADQPKGDLGIPARVASGKPLSVKLATEGKTCQLVTGPEGMTIADNTLSWSPQEKDVGVHTLKIRVISGDSLLFLRPSIEVVPKSLVDAKSGDISKVDEFTKLELGPDLYSLIAGAGQARRNHRRPDPPASGALQVDRRAEGLLCRAVDEPAGAGCDR